MALPRLQCIKGEDVKVLFIFETQCQSVKRAIHHFVCFCCLKVHDAAEMIVIKSQGG